MLPLNPHIEDLLMEIALPARPLQSLHLVVLQASPHGSFQFPPGDLLAGLALLCRFDLGLEARLHAHAHRALERDARGVAADLDCSCSSTGSGARTSSFR